MNVEAMTKILTEVKGWVSKIRNKEVFIISIAIPVVLLYLIEPSSFQYVWKGRLFYTFFLWLFILELLMGWRKLSEEKTIPIGSWRLSGIIITMLIPTLYTILTHIGYLGTIIQLGRLLGVPSEGSTGQYNITYSWPISMEYIVFTTSFLTEMIILYGRNGLQKRFTISTFFIISITFFYTIDTFYRFGSSQLLQSFVPFVAKSTILLLTSIGYKAQMAPISDGWALLINSGEGKIFAIAIYWPCAGVQSLIIYSLVIILFLRDTTISFTRKTAYAIIGGIGTFVVNLFRIATICLIGINQGYQAAEMFHEYYGEIFFIIWLFIFLLTILSIETIKKNRIKKFSQTTACAKS